jgi:hypothetical protein
MYRKVESSSLSRLVAHFQIFRRLMKGKFDAYVLWPLAKKFQNWIVDRSTARDVTVVQKVYVWAIKLSFCQNDPLTGDSGQNEKNYDVKPPIWNIKKYVETNLLRDQKIVRRNIAAVLDERSLLITKGPVGLNHNETLQPP